MFFSLRISKYDQIKVIAEDVAMSFSPYKIHDTDFNLEYLIQSMASQIIVQERQNFIYVARI